MVCFEVITHYKSGRARRQIFASEDEGTMWQYYDKHHNQNLIASTELVDAWLA